MEFYNVGICGIDKKEFHEVFIDLMKRKGYSIIEEGSRSMNISSSSNATEGFKSKKEYVNSQ